MRRGDVVEFKRGDLTIEAEVTRVIRNGDVSRYTCMGTRLPVMFTTSTRWLRVKRTWGDA